MHFAIYLCNTLLKLNTLINVIKSSLAYRVVGIFICKREELHMTSISIKINNCLSLPLFIHPCINHLQPDLQSTNCINTLVHQQTQSVIKCMPAGLCVNMKMSLDAFKFSINTLLVPDKPEENNSLSCQEFKSFKMTFAMSFIMSWLTCIYTVKQPGFKGWKKKNSRGHFLSSL